MKKVGQKYVCGDLSLLLVADPQWEFQIKDVTFSLIRTLQ